MMALGIVVGWLLLGLAIARVAYLLGEFDDEPTDLCVLLTAGAILAAPLWAAVAVVCGLGYGLFRLVTLPSRAQRRERRRVAHEAERQRVAEDARRLGLPMLDEGSTR